MKKQLLKTKNPLRTQAERDAEYRRGLMLRVAGTILLSVLITAAFYLTTVFIFSIG